MKTFILGDRFMNHVLHIHDLHISVSVILVSVECDADDADPLQWLRDSVPGEPGLDYPVLSSPDDVVTGFSCQGLVSGGYYADTETQCQVFHVCLTRDKRVSFLCPNGTIFAQVRIH